MMSVVNNLMLLFGEGSRIVQLSKVGCKRVFNSYKWN